MEKQIGPGQPFQVASGDDEENGKRAMLSELMMGGLCRPLKKTTTHVRQVDGSTWSECISDDGQVVAVTSVQKAIIAPTPGYSDASAILPTFHFCPVANSWEICCKDINNSDSTLLHTVSPYTFVSYNVWFAEEERDRRSTALIELLASRLPDVICLQEVTVSLVVRFSRASVIREHYYMSDSDGSTCHPYGVLMLIKKSFAFQPEFTLHSIPTNMHRHLLMAKCLVRCGSDEQALCIATAHLESMDNAEMRLYQLDSIFGLLLAQPHRYDVVFAGDTNYGDHSMETDFIAAKYPSMVDVGHLLGTGTTFPVQTSVGGSRLDKVYVRNRSDRNACSRDFLTIECIGREPITYSASIRDRLLKKASKKIFISDHAGISMSMHRSNAV